MVNFILLIWLSDSYLQVNAEDNLTIALGIETLSDLYA